LEADNIVLHVDVVNDSDRVVESISEMISHMAINETKNHAFTMTYKVPNYTGKYTLKAYAEAYSGDTIRRNDTISKAFDCEKGVGIAQTGTETWQLGQNIPNPATEITAIPFYLPQGGMVRLSVMGANGQVIYQKDFRGEAGSNQIELNTADLASGLYYYTMEYRGQRITRKMVIQ
ncbi:MAG: T9SS type A sorting domain-containing protein, partial [Bacteroidales bacterium]|nr:T9SS type A sorting domain-containing protein [Bacteroidales bacterium]